MIPTMNKALAMNRFAGIPVAGTALRRPAQLYPEGSVVRIRTGCLAGSK